MHNYTVKKSPNLQYFMTLVPSLKFQNEMLADSFVESFAESCQMHKVELPLRFSTLVNRLVNSNFKNLSARFEH